MKIPEKWAKSFAEAKKDWGGKLDPASIRTACIVLLLGTLQIIWAVGHGEFIAIRLLDGRDWMNAVVHILKVSGFLCGFTAVLGFVTADKDKMVYAQLALGMVQLFLLDLCLLLHFGMAVTGGLIPYVGTVMFINAAERHRNLLESTEKKSDSGVKVYTGSLLLLVLLLPFGYFLSQMLSIYDHSFFPQKAMAVTGSILFVAVLLVAIAGFLWGEKEETRLILKMLVGILCIIYIIALIVAIHLYLSMDQMRMLVCVGVLIAGIGADISGVLAWEPPAY